MVKVLDVRSSGGELQVIGGAFVLPVSTNFVPSPTEGGLRYNSSSQNLEIFTNGTWGAVVTAAIAGAVDFQGNWNASTNLPFLASGVGIKGQYYVATVAGTTNLDGYNVWAVGDMPIFNGTTWDKIDGGNSVGPTGPTGPTGGTGQTGPTGPTGPNGSSGSITTTTITSSTATLTASGVSVIALTLQSDVTLTVLDGDPWQALQIVLIQDATGSRTVTFDATVEFGTDIPGFTATTTASQTDIVTLIFNGSTWMFVAAARGYD